MSSSEEEDNHGIEVYFTAAEFADISEYEKLRMRNMKKNYEMMIKVGLHVPPPDFMRRSAKKKKKVAFEERSEDDESWRPGANRGRKKASAFTVPLKKTGRQKTETKKEAGSFTRPPEIDSDDSFEQLANIVVSDFEDDDTNEEALQTVKQISHKRKGVKTKKELERNETGAKRYSLREGTRKSYKDLEAAEDDVYVYCEDCHELYEDDCPSHPLTVLMDTPVPSKCENRAKLSLPSGLVLKDAGIEGAGKGVWTEKFIPKGVRFGPYGGEIVVNEQAGRESGYSWEIFHDKKRIHYINGKNKHKANWMRYVNCARNEPEQNLIAYQYRGQIYYRTFKPIYKGRELLVYYGEEYAKELGIEEEKFINDGSCHKCSLCTTAFTGRLFLLKHLKYRHRQHVDLTMYQSKSSPNIGRSLCKVVSSSAEQNRQCQMIFQSTRTVMSHLIVKHAESKGVVDSCHEKSYQSGTSHQVTNTTCLAANVKKLDDRTSHKKEIVSDNEVQRQVHHSSGRPHQCKVCGKGLTLNKDLIKHMRVHTGERPYQCQVCMKAFNTQGSLDRHVRIIHEGIKPYQCTQCNKAFTVKCHLTDHMRVHTGERPYQCKVCHKTFTRQGSLDTHMRIHEGIKPYQCTQCNKAFTQQATLTYHMRVHTGERPYQCKVCMKTFNLQGNLDKHVRIHEGIKPYQCTQCNKTFTENGHLIKHMRVHTGERPYQCKVCHKAFTQQAHLDRHMRIHEGIKPYQCTQCNKTFTMHHHLTQHLRIHTGEKPFKCNVCGKTFNCKSTLNNHQSIHSGIKPYQCTHCNMTFARQFILQTHLRIHTGEKPYTCQVCAKGLTQSCSLTGHMRIHTGEKPYKCTTCGNRFAHKSILNTHTRTHSNITS